MRFQLLMYVICFGAMSCSYAQAPIKTVDSTTPAKVAQSVNTPSALPFQKKFGSLPPGAVKWTEHGNAIDNANNIILDEAFIRKALDTPSPSKKIVERLSEFTFRMKGETKERFWQLFNAHLSHSVSPSTAELKTFINRVKANMVFVEGGSFWFGDWGLRPDGPGRLVSNEGESRAPQYVSLSSYSIYKDPVTYADYDVFTRATGRPLFGAQGKYRDFHLDSRFPDYPVKPVLWPEARAYCQWLSQVTGEPFDLPTEAQWEYAARNRGKEVLYAGDVPFDATLLRKNIEGIDRTLDSVARVPVGTYGATALGITGMVGHSYEWVRDGYTTEVLDLNGRENPVSPIKNNERVVRAASDGSRYSALHRFGKPIESIFDRDCRGMPCHVDDRNWQAFRCTLSRPTPWR